ncbi:uncharacterized protein UV8b_07767 [Ustilaginoidea virens]|uniref:Uncharacterized protein n=1 Tax=Ustilaginoidea virens TaxID=1159556 RepID=A0A8E5ML42_USTVR|nr:uncharacterized protein UV8b_07767 [Ustilaginoidea virens]QUC23526.1 hypothetical protein UV8b_07767 [Ustilaginoidea virens]
MYSWNGRWERGMSLGQRREGAAGCVETGPLAWDGVNRWDDDGPRAGRSFDVASRVYKKPGGRTKPRVCGGRSNSTDAGINASQAFMLVAAPRGHAPRTGCRHPAGRDDRGSRCWCGVGVSGGKRLPGLHILMIPVGAANRRLHTIVPSVPQAHPRTAGRTAGRPATGIAPKTACLRPCRRCPSPGPDGPSHPRHHLTLPPVLLGPQSARKPNRSDGRRHTSRRASPVQPTAPQPQRRILDAASPKEPARSKSSSRAHTPPV